MYRRYLLTYRQLYKVIVAWLIESYRPIAKQSLCNQPPDNVHCSHKLSSHIYPLDQSQTSPRIPSVTIDLHYAQRVQGTL